MQLFKIILLFSVGSFLEKIFQWPKKVQLCVCLRVCSSVSGCTCVCVYMYACMYASLRMCMFVYVCLCLNRERLWFYLMKKCGLSKKKEHSFSFELRYDICYR